MLIHLNHLMPHRLFQEDRDRRGHQQGPGSRQERRVPARGTADAALAAAVGRKGIEKTDIVSQTWAI